MWWTMIDCFENRGLNMGERPLLMLNEWMGLGYKGLAGVGLYCQQNETLKSQ